MQTNTEFPTYVFATVNPGRVQKVVEELKNNSQIDMIAPVTGRYDLALRLKSSAPNEVYNTVKQISNIPGFVEAFAVPGQFDIVAFWQARTTEEIMKTSINQLTNVGGLFKSETLLAYAPVFKA